jgi:hypothetical protein
MKRDINTTGAAARALSARNPVTFTCVYPLEESIRRLAAITDTPVAQHPKGSVDETTVRLEWDRVRFEGRWGSQLDVATLEGVMVPHGVARTVVPAFAVVTFTAVAAAANGGGYWMAGIMIGIFLVAMPLFVAYLGSARVVAEIELERIIGRTIGDPEKYAVQWRRWSDT